MVDSGPQVTLRADGTGLHLQHGPIDLLIEADGPRHSRRAAFEAATERFHGLLAGLVDELELLRTPIVEHRRGSRPSGAVATRMVDAVRAFEAENLTPMAAVAGAVADEIAQAMGDSVIDRSGSTLGPGDERGQTLDRWSVNNGGDISLGLRQGFTYTVGVVADPRRPSVELTIPIDAASGVTGIATSGRHGRSLSLGIADAVTVLATSAAAADAAATSIANHVNLGSHPAVVHAPAVELDANSDLGSELVTVDVGVLSDAEVRTALDQGLEAAEDYVSSGLVTGAILRLEDRITATAALDVSRSPQLRDTDHDGRIRLRT